MKRMKKTYVSFILVLLLAVSPFLIASADSGTNYTAMTSVKVSFNQALSIVSDAYPDLTLFALSLDDENGVFVYQAELLNPIDSSVIEIAINSESGQISAQANDINDQNDQDEQTGENVQYEGNSQDEFNDENENSSDESQDESTGDEFSALGSSVMSFAMEIQIVINGESGQISAQANDVNDQNDQGEQTGENVQYEGNSKDELNDEHENSSDESQDESTEDEYSTLNVSMVTITFDQALSTAKEAYPGYMLLTLGLEDENGVLMYQAALLNPVDHSVVEISIDCVSGQILPQTAENGQN